MAIKKTTLYLFILVLTLAFAGDAFAFWIWTPKEKKLVNPKNVAKDTPKEQFRWAMEFYENKDYKRAAEEFDRLASTFKDSDIAPEAQYYAGLSYEKAGKPYPAFQAYQKTIDSYPFTKRINEIIEKEYSLGSELYKKHSAKLMGKEIMTDLDRAAEIFKTVKNNVPFGEYADRAQYMIAECYKKSEQYNEAAQEFQKILNEYPNSSLADKARYEVAQCTYLASLKPDYDQDLTDEAIKEFKKIERTRRGMPLAAEANQAINRLENKKAESIFNTAKFYEKGKRYKSAAIYYEEVLKKYPGSNFAELARIKADQMAVLAEKNKAKPKKAKTKPAKDTEKKKKKWIFF